MPPCRLKAGLNLLSDGLIFPHESFIIVSLINQHLSGEPKCPISVKTSSNSLWHKFFSSTNRWITNNHGIILRVDIVIRITFVNRDILNAIRFGIPLRQIHSTFIHVNHLHRHLGICLCKRQSHRAITATDI